MMLDKKQIQAIFFTIWATKEVLWVIFLSEFKMGNKAVETTPNINNTVGPGAPKEYMVHWGFKKFCKGNKSLEDEEHSGRPRKLTMTNWEQSLKLILIQLHKRVA